jgi:hypothetical protein
MPVAGIAFQAKKGSRRAQPGGDDTTKRQTQLPDRSGALDESCSREYWEEETWIITLEM